MDALVISQSFESAGMCSSSSRYNCDCETRSRNEVKHNCRAGV